MNVKSLRLIGFKSFCNQTEMSFHHGVNAIVGPNGCGKSNISDALKWVMGEQNVRNLRGDRLEDIIFAGSRENKPLGMAEVTMIVENNGGGLPPQYKDFTELEITRRVYRSGESEYLINKKPCLLKNIREIFMDTGLNPKAYSIIEQGSIMDIVRSSPQDLRRMIEEAAGITKFRERKAETLRKIKSTKENLERVNDIIIEVDRQIRTARRQANEARRFIASKDELTRIEASLYYHHYRELKTGWESAASRHGGLAEEDEKLRTAINVAEAGMEKSRLSLLETEKELSDSQESYYRSSGRLELSENQIKHLDERLIDYRQSVENAGQSIIKLKTRLEEVHKEIREKEESLGATEKELAEMSPSLDEYRRKAADFDSEIKGRRAEHDRTRRDLNRTVLDKRALLETVTEAQARLGGDEKFLSDYAAESLRLAKLAEASTSDKKEVERKLKQSLAQFDTISAGLRNVEEEFTLCERRLKEETDFIEAAVRRQTEIEGRLGYLQNLQKQGENLKEGARRLYQLASGRESGEGKFVGVLGHLIQVDEKYRKAIEVVLADRIEAVLVKGEDQAVSLADKLKDEGVQGATVVPYETWPETEEPPAPPEGSLGPAWRFVRTDNGVSGLVKFLLRDVCLTANMKEALDLRKKAKRPATFCTLDGDVVHAWGGLTIGSEAVSPQGVLGTAEELKKLTIEADKSRKKLAESEAGAKGLKEELERLKTRKTALERDKFEAGQLTTNFRAESEKLAREIEQTTGRKLRIDEDLERRGKEREKDQAALESFKHKLKDIEEKEKELSEAVERMEEERHMSDHKRDELNGRISEMEVARAAAVEKKRSQEGAMGRLSRESEDIERRITEYRNSSVDLQNKIKEAESSLEQNRMLMEELKIKSSKAREEIDRLQAAHSAASDEADKKSEELKQLRNRRESVSGKMSSVSVEMAELKTRMEETASRACSETGHDPAKDPMEELEEYISQPVEQVRERAHRLKTRMARIGPVNMAAVEELETLTERSTFLSTQKEDLEKAIESLNEAIRKINRSSRERFGTTFEKVNDKFGETFQVLFNGGEALLALEEGVDLLDAGINIYAQPPGKKMSKLNLLSGGEKAMTALALLFALFSVRPAPFCLMDEVDAPLDDANVDRFLKLIDGSIKGSQIVLITHNKKSMEKADNLVGVTMESPGVSKLVSVLLNTSN